MNGELAKVYSSCGESDRNLIDCYLDIAWRLKPQLQKQNLPPQVDNIGFLLVVVKRTWFL
jgi:hypothetical protein